MAAASYAGVFREVTVAWKVEGRRGLDRFMAHHLAASVALIAGNRDSVSLVPIPSTRRSRRRRGRDLVADTAELAGRMLRDAGLDARTERSLVLSRQTADQHLLSADERIANVRGAFALGTVPRCPIVVVDDIVTTGSTVSAAELALREHAADVLGSAVIAATPERPLARTTAAGLRSK